MKDYQTKCYQCETDIYVNLSNSITVKDKVISCIKWTCSKCNYENTIYYPFGADIIK